MVQNKSLIFKSIPDGWPRIGEHLAVETHEFDADAKPPPGGVTVKVLYVSLDPYQRGRMRAPTAKSYSPPYELGKPMDNFGVARVLHSDTEHFAAGDMMLGFFPIAEYGTIPAGELKNTTMRGFRKLHNPYNLELTTFINSLGMPGLTAYSSLYDIGQPKKGETIFVSSAAGAVGLLVGQLAKREGLTVIGSVGDDDKLAMIKECGFDDGFNYKKEKAAAALQRLCPDGIDIYYENVGGEQLEAALDNMRDFGRVVACGMISQYSARPEERYGIPNMGLVVSRRLTIRGFIVGDDNMGPRYIDAHQKNVAAWLADGSLQQRVHVTQGIDHAADALLGMWAGKNHGKAVLKIAD